MALSDIFASSFAGLRMGLALLESSARTVANPAAWGMAAPPSTSPTTFQEMLTVQLAAVAGQGQVLQGGLTQTEMPASTPAQTWQDALTHPEIESFDLVGAMINAIIAQRMIEANARLISIENEVVGTIIDLGRYPGDMRR